MNTLITFSEIQLKQTKDRILDQQRLLGLETFLITFSLDGFMVCSNLEAFSLIISFSVIRKKNKTPRKIISSDVAKRDIKRYPKSQYEPMKKFRFSKEVESNEDIEQCLLELVDITQKLKRADINVVPELNPELLKDREHTQKIKSILDSVLTL
ncbi:hypothetical protein [Vibrio astriarenae]|uniref:hypothetical protein n=1 Tax=Vibrio astriarenae TaxID=1481923 RepID=UPI0037369FC1